MGINLDGNWAATPCNIEPQNFRGCPIGEPCPVPEHVNNRMKDILNYVFNKSVNVDSEKKTTHELH